MTTTTQPIPLKTLSQSIIDFYRTKTSAGYGVPLLITGPPGIAKSEYVPIFAEKISELEGVPVVVITERLGNRDHLDIRGYAVPTKREDGRLITAYTMPDLVNRVEQINAQYDGKCIIILFLDELYQASLPTQKVLAELTGEYRIGEYSFPSNLWIVAATNRRQDNAGVSKALSIIRNRMTEIPVELPIEDWAQWASNNNLPPLGIAAAICNQELFVSEVPKEAAFMTPRSFTYALKLLATAAERLGIDTETALPLGSEYPAQTLGVDGYIGEGARRIIEEWFKIGQHLPRLSAIIRDPGSAQSLPQDRLDAHYAMSQKIIAHKETGDFEPLWRYAERCINASILPSVAARFYLSAEMEQADMSSFNAWLTHKDEQGRQPHIELVQAAMG